MIVKLERGLDRWSREESAASADAVLGAVRRRTRASRARRTTIVLAGALGLGLLIGGGFWAADWWQNRPAQDPFGEPEATTAWSEPAPPSKAVVEARCGKEFAVGYDQSFATHWGEMIAAGGDKSCALGWEEAPSKKSVPAKNWPTTVAGYREACQSLTGKNLAGWQLVARSERVGFRLGAADEIELQSFAYRSANGWLADCTLASDTSGGMSAESPFRGSLDLARAVDVAEAPEQKGATVFESGDAVAFVRGVVGTDGRADLPDPRARTVRVDLGHGIPACEAPVTNGHVMAACRFSVPPGTDLGVDPGFHSAGVDVTVLDAWRRALRTFHLGL